MDSVSVPNKEEPLLNSEESPTIRSKKRRQQAWETSVDIYAAQCDKCQKWRVISTQEEFEEIRSKLSTDPFHCNRKPDTSCEDPADINFDATRTWVIDKPDLPKTPKGFKRTLVLRKDYSKMDVYYYTPLGKKMRTRNEVAAFLKDNPEYKDLSPDDFRFTTPKVVEETIPPNSFVTAKSSSSASSNRQKQKKLREADEKPTSSDSES